MDREKLLKESMELVNPIKPLLTVKVGEVQANEIMRMLKDAIEFGFKQGELVGRIAGMAEGAAMVFKELDKKARENEFL